MSRRRLWVVSELYYPEQTSTGYFLTRIAEGLAPDFDVRVVCSRPTYSERHLHVACREERLGTLIHRMRSTRFSKDAIVGRVLNMLTFTVSAAVFCLLQFRRDDRVLIVTNPPLLPPLVGLIAKLRGVVATLLVHDVYPEVLLATGHLRRDGMPYRLLYAAAASTYRQFADVVVLGRDMAEVASAKLRNAKTRLHIIPNWGDVHEIRPIAAKDNLFRQLHGMGDRPVIQFAGNLGRTHDVEAVLDAAHALAPDTDVTFCFIGYGGKAGLVQQQSRREALGNVRFLPRQPRDMLGPMLASADAAVIAFVDEMFGVSVPSRMYNIMAAGVPIIAIADPRSELARVVTEEHCGWTIDSKGSQDLVLVARALATPEGRREAAARGARGREAVVRRFTLPIVLAQFRRVLGADDAGNWSGLGVSPPY